jgi:hypothetical protein
VRARASEELPVEIQRICDLLEGHLTVEGDTIEGDHLEHGDVLDHWHIRILCRVHADDIGPTRVGPVERDVRGDCFLLQRIGLLHVGIQRGIGRQRSVRAAAEEREPEQQEVRRE